MRVLLATVAITLLTSPLEAQRKCPTMNGFIDELIIPERTSRTATFALTCGFTVQPEVIFRTFDARARRSGHVPLGIITVEADDALYKQYVFVLMREGADVRVNLVLTAHDRIVYKGTAVLAEAEFSKYRESLLKFPYLRHATSTREDPHNIVLWRDSARSPSVLRVGAERPAERTADGLIQGPDYEDVFEIIIDPLIAILTQTYS